jgi:hypothetical protein
MLNTMTQKLVFKKKRKPNLEEQKNCQYLRKPKLRAGYYRKGVQHFMYSLLRYRDKML